MRFLFGLADTVSVIHWGQVIAAGTPAELRENPWVQRSNLGAWRRRRDAGRIDAAPSVETFYGETQALFGVSLEVGRGEVVALLGPNGAGKTTLLRSVLGLTPARRGRIRFDGARHHPRADARDRPRAASAGCPTTGASSRPSRWRATSRSRARRRAFRAWSEKECFEIFSALEYLMQRECENLSGGEMQMVAISRALLGAPGLVLFDEPSQGLAPKIVQDVMKTIRAPAATRASACCVVEQNVQSALAVADRVYVLDRGRIVHDGPAARAARRRRAPRRAAGRVTSWPRRCSTSTASPSATPAACSSRR